MMRFASLRQRAGAFLIDYLVISLYMLVLVLLSFGPLRGVMPGLFTDPNRSQASAFVLLVAPVILYFALLESSARKASWGKRRMGLAVTDLQGRRLSFGRALARSLIKFVPWELTHTCLWRIPGWPLAPAAPGPLIILGLILVWVLVGAYLISMLMNKNHQALYDQIAGTVVIDTKATTG